MDFLGRTGQCEENGYIKFIDTTGKVVIDKKMPYIPNMEGYVFHGGYCMVDTYSIL